jgi:hypothetical protein
VVAFRIVFLRMHLSISLQELLIYRGIIYCDRCGDRAGVNQIHVNKLSKTCVFPGAVSARRKVIDCVKAGECYSVYRGVATWLNEL